MSIFHDGVLVDVHVRYWTGAVQLTAADFGLAPEQVSTAYKFGRKYLIPEEIIKRFRTIESKARYAVDLNSFSFPVGHANFVPKKRQKKVFKELEELKVAYQQLVDDLIENFTTYKDQMIPVYREAAEQAYKNSRPAGISEFSIETQDAELEEFTQNFMTRINSYYPEPQTLLSRFDLNWDVYTISLDATKTTASGALSRMQREDEAHLHDLTSQALSTAREEARHQLDVEAYREQTQARIGGFVEDVVKVLRSQTRKLCEEISENIRNGQVITGRTYNRIRDFIEKYKDMNFVGDGQVEEELEAFRREFLDVHTTEQVKDDGELKEELGRRLRLISAKATELSDVSEVTGEYSRRVMFRRPPSQPDEGNV